MSQMPIAKHYDNKVVIFIGMNLINHTKHIVVNCISFTKKVSKGKCTTPHMPSLDQIVDIFTKSLNNISHNSLVTKLCIFDAHTSSSR